MWAGVGEGAETLRAVAGRLESSLEALGFEREKRGYTPHITLGRARKSPARLGDVEEMPPVPGFTAWRLELVESALGREGARYATLGEYSFKRRRTEGR